jgi:hypothetical protein
MIKDTDDVRVNICTGGSCHFDNFTMTADVAKMLLSPGKYEGLIHRRVCPDGKPAGL